MDITVTPHTTSTELLTASELADWLKVSQRTVSKYVKCGMPAMHLGDHRHLRFERVPVLAWLQERAAQKQQLKTATAGLHPTSAALH